MKKSTAPATESTKTIEFKKNPAEIIFLALLSAWLLCSTMGILLTQEHFYNVSFVTNLNNIGFIIAILVAAAILVAYGSISKSIFYGALPFSLMLYGTVASYESADIYTAVAFFALVLVSLVWLVKSERLNIPSFKIKESHALILICAVGILSAAYIVYVSVIQYLSYSTPVSNTGVIVQMFHNILTTGSPMTTIEYGELVSHFSVDIAPILWVLFPIYALIKTPVALLVVQILAMLSGIVPLYLIAKKRALTIEKCTLICILYAVSPAVLGAAFSGLSETCFALPLLLWMLYSVDKKRVVASLLFSVGVMLCGYELAIWVLAVGVWAVVRRKTKLGVTLAVTSLAYYVLAVVMLILAEKVEILAQYYNVIGGESGFLGLITSILKNPAMIVFQSAFPEKICYIAAFLLPLGLLTVKRIRPADSILLIPAVIMNLLPGYSEVMTSGYNSYYRLLSDRSVCVIAIVFYLAVINLSALEKCEQESPAGEKNEKKAKPESKNSIFSSKGTIVLAVCATVLVLASQTAPQIEYVTGYFADRDDIRKIESALEKIPDDAEVSASTYISTHLADRNTIYKLTDEKSTQYVVLDLRNGETDISGAKYSVEFFKEKGYSEVFYEKDVIAVLAVEKKT